ncbi:MAG: sodium/solute symporter [Sedimentisphaerales bacterium]|nr:sodium/solute symporter [Sedimentisphaerales bacterium]
MEDLNTFSLNVWDYLAFCGYFLVLCLIGWWAGRREKSGPEDYFLAGRTLPWYVVGTSFIASNISTEHFIGMIGAAFVFGVSVSMAEWANIMTFSILIWFFIPFLLATRVFTIPEFLNQRYNSTIRYFFAVVTIISNVVAFMAAVLYGGGLALQALFGWNLWFSIIALGVVAGSWAIYGGLRSVAWTDCFTVVVMIVGGIMVTILGLYVLSGDEHSLIEGFKIMVERNQAETGIWKEVVDQHAWDLAKVSDYNRLSVIQPITHQINPWPGIFFGWLAVGIWYNVINQFMIQRVLGAKNGYHARMGIVLAGYMKVFMPFIVVLPGLILFARYPEVMQLPYNEIRPEADKGYVNMLQELMPMGLRGLFLAALFGAIQSTINSVLNSTATIFTWDIYKQFINKAATDKTLVRVGVWASVIFLVLSILLGRSIEFIGGSLFVYIQTLYAFFAPPFAAIFLLGILFRRINGKGAVATVMSGFLFGIAVKLYIQFWPDSYLWIEPYSIQAIINWVFCVIICVTVSLMTAPPDPQRVTDNLTINWKKINIFKGLGNHWYTSVILWWSIFAFIIIGLVILLSGRFV